MTAISLDDLIALNDEIAALVRAGVPLQSGLAELGGDLPGRLGRLSTALAERTARGESLAQAVAADAGELPAAYRAVVAAGLRAGRLPAALESVAKSARRTAETRRATVGGVAYPLLVVILAWCGLAFFASVLAPQMAWGFREFGMPAQRFFAILARAGRHVWWWGPIVPAVLMVFMAAWWSACRRAGGRWSDRLCGLMPGMGRLLRCSRTAAFLDVLALLIEHETPLAEAVLLAGEAAGDRPTLRSARQWAAAAESGLPRPAGAAATFPPLVEWLFSAAGRSGALAPALRSAADAYHRRARRQADMLRTFLPILLTVVIGGGAAALYALMLFIPYTAMLRGLS